MIMKNKNSKTSLNIASVQMHITQDQKTNLKTMEEYLQHIQNTFPQIDMVVFPELCAMNVGKSMDNDAEEIPGVLTSIFSTYLAIISVSILTTSPTFLKERFVLL